MNTQELFDLLLTSGQELVDKGKALAEENLQLPDDPEERKKLFEGAGKGAVAASALAVLLGTRFGRKLTGAGIKLGSLAALGTVAYNAFQKWQSQNGITDAGQPIAELSAAEANQRGKVLLLAMVAAAKVDGTVDEPEKAAILEQLNKLNLGDNSAGLLTEALSKPVDIKAIAASADNPAAAAEIYLISRAIVDLDNEQEQQYIHQLAAELKLAPDLVAQLENQLKA